MTLVLTELSQFGIAMAADSAITFQVPTPSGRTISRVLHGAKKLQIVPHIKAGIACWGLGTINGVNTDIWMADLVKRSVQNTTDLHSFANFLASELNTALGQNAPPAGFHVAGFIDGISGPEPAFYHVHNGPSQVIAGINPAIFNANFDRPPQSNGPNQFYITRNGDYRFYAYFFNQLMRLIQGIHADPQLSGVQIPFPPSLYSRAKFLRLQIQTVASLYDVSNLVPGIGGPITILGIGPQGYEFFETF